MSKYKCYLVEEENDVDEEGQAQGKVLEVVEVSGKQALQHKAQYN